jgi:hypothetical protein
MSNWNEKLSRAQKERWTRERARHLQAVDLDAVEWGVVGPPHPEYEATDFVLVSPGQVFDNSTGEVRAAATFEEVRDSVFLFAVALEMEKPIVAGTTLKDLFRRVFDEWVEQEWPSIHPYSHKILRGFTKDFYANTLEEYWTFSESEDAGQFLIPPMPTLRSAKERRVDTDPIKAEKAAKIAHTRWHINGTLDRPARPSPKCKFCVEPIEEAENDS